MTTAVAPTAPNGSGGIIQSMAHQYGLEANRFLATIKATVFPQGKEVSLEQTAAFLVVAHQYKLNPFIKEIYAFPGRGGGVVPIVSVDGWATLINRQEQLDGIQFEDHLDESVLVAVTCRIYRKDRTHPTEVTEYMSECRRDTDTWRKWPARMLRHKALIQCARYAFGLVGIYDPDEAERIAESGGADPSPLAMPTRKSESQVVEGQIVSHATDAEAEQSEGTTVGAQGQAGLAFNPLAGTSGDYLTAKDAKRISDMCGKLGLDPDETAARFFNLEGLKVDELKHEAASMLIGDLKERTDAKS